MDVVCSRWPRVRNVEAWLRQWRRNGGVINGASTETILIRDTIRQVNPLMTPTQQGIELVNVFNLMTIYEDRCRMRFAKMPHSHSSCLILGQVNGFLDTFNLRSWEPVPQGQQKQSQ
jgi:hypothetical protein